MDQRQSGPRATALLLSLGNAHLTSGRESPPKRGNHASSFDMGEPTTTRSVESDSRTVYLDSDALLGPRAAIAARALDRRAVLRCFGVALHDTLHARHTKRWAIEHDIELADSDDPDDRQLAVDRRLLEEPRMEAHGVREFPPDSARPVRPPRAAGARPLRMLRSRASPRVSAVAPAPAVAKGPPLA